MSQFIKRTLALLAALALLPISLYGCTGGTESGSVTVGIAQDIASLDPHMATTAGTREVMFNLFEGLVKAGPDGSVIPASRPNRRDIWTACMTSTTPGPWSRKSGRP